MPGENGAMNAINDAQRQRADIQRDIGRLEGKVDSILTAIQNMTAGMVRADAERDNLARNMQVVEHKAMEAMKDLREDFQRNHSDLKSKLYWLGGAASAGGLGVGAVGARIVAGLFGMHP
jgi:seryl-tRNA synthetase